MIGPKTPQQHPFRRGLEALKKGTETADNVEATPIALLTDRKSAVVEALVVSVSLDPPSKPNTRVVFEDATGTLEATWLGRTGIRGIEPGRLLRLKGIVSIDRGRICMVNPRYEVCQ